METATSLTTVLEAVNTMLSCAGESPVNTLATTGMVDVAVAVATLNETSRSVQSVGWHFNTEDDYPLVRDAEGFIYLPANMLTVDVNQNYTTCLPIQRGLKMYDKQNHTYVFTVDLTASVQLLLGWDELPQTARYYILIKAARSFQARVLGADSLHRFSEADEMSALVALQEAEGKSGNYNMFQNYSAANIMNTNWSF